MDIILRNFFNIIRSGAFNDKSRIEVMSPFKWRRLFLMVEEQNVVNLFVRGVNANADDENLNIPSGLVDEIQKSLGVSESKIARQEDNIVALSNKFFNKKLRKIIDRERHSIDTSVEALDVLKLIVFNTNAMLNHGISLGGIIKLGQFLRSKGDKVDFIKLESWLISLRLIRMAQLQGSILIAFFGFEQNELPFVIKEESNAYKLTIKTVLNLAKDATEEWHFKQNSAGFVRNNGAVLRKNLRRSLRYIEYAPIETTSNFINNFLKSLSEIEE